MTSNQKKAAAAVRQLTVAPKQKHVRADGSMYYRIVSPTTRVQPMINSIRDAGMTCDTGHYGNYVEVDLPA